MAERELSFHHFETEVLKAPGEAREASFQETLTKAKEIIRNSPNRTVFSIFRDESIDDPSLLPRIEDALGDDVLIVKPEPSRSFRDLLSQAGRVDKKILILHPLRVQELSSIAGETPIESVRRYSRYVERVESFLSKIFPDRPHVIANLTSKESAEQTISALGPGISSKDQIGYYLRLRGRELYLVHPQGEQALNNWIEGLDRIFQRQVQQSDYRLRQYIRQESVSFPEPRPVPEGIRRMVEIIRADLSSIPGAKVEVFDTSSYPVVTASISASQHPESARTLLVYGMLDTRPAGDESEWIAPPFSAQTKEIEGEKRIIGRGAFNTKHGIAGLVDVVQVLSQEGRLPVNIEIIIDPEEEVRSTAISETLEKKRDAYRKVDAALYPVCAETYKSIWLSFKGFAQARINFRAARSETHSGFSAVTKTPRLLEGVSRYLISVQRENEEDPAISDFHGEITSKDRELAKLFAEQISLEEFAKMRGLRAEELRSTDVAQLVLDEMRTTVNIVGWGAEVKPGSLPTKAFAEVEFRLAPSVKLTTTDIERKIRDYLQNRGESLPEGVEIESVEFVSGTDEGFQAAKFDDPMVKAMQDTYRSFSKEFRIIPSVFGSVPAGAKIVRKLNVPFLMGGLGVGGRQHVANEYLTEGSYEEFKKFLTIFLHQFARQKGAKHE